MNYLDIILSIPLLIGLYKGISRGIIKELASLLALIIGIYGAVHFSEQLQPKLQTSIFIDESFLPIIISAFLLVFNTLEHHLELIPDEQKKNSLLYQPLSEMLSFLVPEGGDGNSLIEEAQKVWQEAEQAIPL